jgi:hypothetical protein
MTEAQLRQAKENFKAVRLSQVKADVLALEMLRHPDATAEHLESAHRLILHIDKMMTDMVTSLREVLPDRGGFLSTYEWNAPAYNRFYKPKEK